MVIQFFIEMIFDLVEGIIELIPDSVTEIMGSFNAGLAQFSVVLERASCFIPFSAIAACVGIWFVIYNLELIIRIVNWLIRKIPSID